MAQLLVTHVDEKLVAALKLQAAAHGRSAEAEHRVILSESLLGRRPIKRTFKEVLAAMPYFDDGDLFDLR